MSIAGKTGTSTDYWDVWFAGFTPYYTCSVWAGYDNNVSMSRSSGNREDHVARNLWRSIMSRVHENLPNEQFSTPSGIVHASVCTQSGKLPIPGICDTVRNEAFADGTIPTENCTVHYVGSVCGYDGLPASPGCPFPREGVAILPLQEDPSLLSGSSSFVTNPDGTVTPGTAGTVNYCQHDDNFYANPDYQTILDAQAWELAVRDAEAAGTYEEPPAEEGGEEGGGE